MSSMRKTNLLIAALFLFAAILAGCSKENGNPANPPMGSVVMPSEVPATSSADPSENSGQAEEEPTTSPSSSSDTVAPQSKVTALRLADFKTGWAGGEGWIARTDDSGKSWKTQLEHKYIVNQLFALNNLEVWATLDIGDSKQLKLLHSTDGGTKWVEIGYVPNYGFLHFVTSEEGFSANAQTKDGGKTWSKLPQPADIAGDAYFHDGNNGWAVTQNKDKNTLDIVRTTDGGKVWTTVLKRTTVASINGAVIRSAGKKDAWVELIGDSGMSQTSYSLFHTADGGKTWIPVLANNQAGSGPAPGYKMDQETKVPSNSGSGPGALYVVNPKVAFMGGQCMACDLPNTMGKTMDGGKSWINLPSMFPGYGNQLIAAADAEHIWWINTDNEESSIMYTSTDGGKHWKVAHTFDKPKPAAG